MVVQWDFTLVKAYDKEIMHCFPNVLVGCIIKDLRTRCVDRECIHVIGKNKSSSYSMHGLSSCCITKWGHCFPPNDAAVSSVYRECAEDHGSWIDTVSHILYYTHGQSSQHAHVYKGTCSVFAGSNPIPRTVRCSQERFIQIAMGIRKKYINIACNSATVCLVNDGYIQSTHKVCQLLLHASYMS